MVEDYSDFVKAELMKEGRVMDMKIDRKERPKLKAG